MTLVQKRGMEETIKNNLSIHGFQYYVYKDPDYVLGPWLHTAFEQTLASEEEQAFNTSISALWIAVE